MLPLKTRTWIAALGAVLGLAAPSGAQELLSPTRGYITIVEPREWMGEGVVVRGIGRSLRVRGTAFHPAGVVRVTVNGADAAVQPRDNGAIGFIGSVAADAVARDVEIVAYPRDGEPIVRVQRSSGGWVYGRLPNALPSPLVNAGGPALTVSLSALPAAAQRAVVGALRGDPVIRVSTSGASRLTIRRDGGEFVVTGADGTVRHRIPTPGDTEVAPLIGVLMQEYGALQFAELPAPAATFGLDFAFTSRGDFRLGQGIEFRVRPARSGYLTVVDLGTNGVIALLYPTPADEPQVTAGTELRLPSQAARTLYAPQAPYTAAEPLGTGAVRAFVTPRPLKLVDAASGVVTAGELLRALREATSGTEPWATAALTYRILP